MIRTFKQMERHKRMSARINPCRIRDLDCTEDCGCVNEGTHYWNSLWKFHLQIQFLDTGEPLAGYSKVHKAYSFAASVSTVKLVSSVPANSTSFLTRCSF